MQQPSQLSGARSVLAEAAEQIDEIRGMYQQSLAEKQVPERLPRRVKNALENQRSALDYLAYELVEEFGSSGKRSLYPMAPTADAFAKSAKKDLPGVGDARPDILSVVERHQPFQPDHQWMDVLTERVNAIKHRRLTPQTRTETTRIEARGPGGSMVSWNPAGVRFGGNVLINGHPVDPRTQLPTGGDVTKTIFVDWQFEGTGLSVLGTLERVQQNVVAVLDDFSQLLGW